MRQHTYERLENLYERYHGYIKTKELLESGYTNRQISYLQQEGYLEKIANGFFWFAKTGLSKPKDYKAIEICMVNPEAVIAADSACFYQGLIDREPSKVSVCTRRDDRHQMSFPFTIVRHYLSEDYFNIDKKRISTEFGSYNVYSIDRSVYDCIRFKDSIEKDSFDIVIEIYQEKNQKRRDTERLLAYAQKMKFISQVENYIKS